MIIGGVSVYLRAVPMHAWAWFLDQATMSITVQRDDAAFIRVKEWFLDQQFLKRIPASGIWKIWRGLSAQKISIARWVSLRRARPAKTVSSKSFLPSKREGSRFRNDG
jgi:hypothetical protein